MTFPDGLLEAAAEGHKDAIIDLAYVLIDLGDARGKDLLWRLQDNRPMEDWATITSRCCPRCGVPAHFTDSIRNGRFKCHVADIVYKEDTKSWGMGGPCHYECEVEELLQPLTQRSKRV